MISQILADMEEVIGGMPFGDIIEFQSGVGSESGIGLIDFNEMYRSIHNRNISKLLTSSDKYDLILRLLGRIDEENLLILGLKRNNVGKILSAINDRPINRLDAEHMICKLFLIYEVMPGGGRAFSKNPYLYFPHCHPIKNFSCTRLEIKATRILKTFKNYIDCNRWTSPILVGVSKLVSDNHNDITLPGKYTEYDAKIQHDNNCDMTLSRKYAVDDTQKMRVLIQDIYQSPFTHSIYSQKKYTNKRKNLSDIVDYACVERQIEMSTGLIMGMAMIYSNFGETELEVLDHPEVNACLKRDTIRCMKTEELSGMTMITLDLNSIGRPDRHICCNINMLGRDNHEPTAILNKAKKRVNEIYLD